MADVLDLDGRPPKGNPYSTRTKMLGLRVSLPTAAWVAAEAERDGVPVAVMLRRYVERAQQGSRYPDDVQEWLLRQAAQCGTPHDPDQAVVEVVRHLAKRWPNGCRLNP